MTIPNKDNSGCIDHEKGIQMICEHCPIDFKGTKEICKTIKSLALQAIQKGN